MFHEALTGDTVPRCWTTVYTHILEPTQASYQVDQAPEAVLPVEELQDCPEGEGDGEEHGGVATARRVGTLQQPQGVAHHVRQDGGRQHAHLGGEHTEQHEQELTHHFMYKFLCVMQL